MAETKAQQPAKAAAPKAEPKPKPGGDVVARAGGYVDRGDGNGWVLEGEK